MFDRKAITVALEKPPHRILMVVRENSMDGAVVFADAARLKPRMDDLLRSFPSDYKEEKRRHAVEGFAEAAFNAETCTIPGPHENPLPLPDVNWFEGALTFTDGITRAALLIELGARYVPLQAKSLTEALSIHGAFGGARPPESVALYLVDEQTRQNMALSYTAG